MSLRQIQKQLDKQQQQQAQVALEDLSIVDLPKKPKQTFAQFQLSDDDDEDQKSDQSDQEQDTAKTKTQKQGEDGQKKKKKKRNKKKKNKEPTDAADDTIKPDLKKAPSTQPKKKVDDDSAFLDNIIKQNKEELKNQGFGYFNGADSVLKMDRKYFNYKKELKSLFQKSAQAFGAMGLDEEEKEERKNRGANELAEQYEGASKKMKRRIKMIEKLQDKTRIGAGGRKYLLVQPNPSWPKVEKILGMEQVRIDKKTGQKIFSYQKSPEYVSLQKEFERVQATNDIQNLINFLHKNFYHHESLVYFADFLRIQGKFSDSFHFLERCLFAFESAWIFEYQPVPPEKAETQEFVPQVRLDLEREYLNKVFCDCLVKYIDILGRKGCSRTSLEYCKFLLSTNPYTDPYGALLRIDFYALRAHDYQLYIDFIRRLPLELHPEEPCSSLLILPNVLLSVALAKFSTIYDKTQEHSPSAGDLGKSLSTLLSLEGHLNQLLDADEPEPFLIAAVCLYPQQVAMMAKKVGQKQINQVFKKAGYEGYQGKTWTEILKHEIFAQSDVDQSMESDYTWTLSNEERLKNSTEKQTELAEETLNKLYNIYVSRSSSLFAPEHILQWLKEVIGYILNRLDDGSLDRELIIAKFTSLTGVPFCNLSRYRGLRQSDFTDDITTINANELLLGEQQQQQDQHDHQQQQQAQQIQQMINQLQQPRNPMMMQQQNHQQMFQERDLEGMTEQEMIAMQEAIMAQMQGENEDIYVDEEDEGDEEGDQDGQGGAGGIRGLINNIFGGWNNNNNNNNGQQPPQQ